MDVGLSADRFALDEIEGELPNDAELEALALGLPLDGLEFVPDGSAHEPKAADGLLPSWYMPAPIARYLGGWRQKVIAGLVLAMFVIEAAGLCTTYGPIG